MISKSETGSEMNDEEPGKLFIGGLSWETTEEKLQQYFSEYGEIIDSVIMKNTESGQSRGFGFVTFAEPDCVKKVLTKGNHILDGRAIDPKLCSSKSALKLKKNLQFPKVFLGGLPFNVTETELRMIFSRFGEVMDVIIMYDHEKNKCRGFGFLSFEKEEEINKCVAEHYVCVNGKKVEVKRAEPRDGKIGPVNQWDRNPDYSQNPTFHNYAGWVPASNQAYGCTPLPNNPVPYGGWSNATPQWGQNYGNPTFNPYGAPQPTYGNWNWNMQPPVASIVPPASIPTPVGVQPLNGTPPMASSHVLSPDQYHQPSSLVPTAHHVSVSSVAKPEFSSYVGYTGYPPQGPTYNAGNIRAYPVDPNNPVSVDVYGTGPGPQRNNQSQQSYHPYRRI